jgi:hypothetical protein
LRDLGAKVTPYGDGMVERVREIAGGVPDKVLHTAQVSLACCHISSRLWTAIRSA